MVKYDKDKLSVVLASHRAWLEDNGGEQANLYNANLCGADLYNANLCNANLCGANLRNADLRNADLRNADLYNADLCNANLRNADLYNADLCNADLCNANLCNANLCNANLRNADLRNANLCNANLCNADLCNANLLGAKLPHFQIPQDGTLIVYKALGKSICKLEIPSNAKRTISLVGRKCRAEFANILSIIDKSGNNIESDYGKHDSNFKYTVGEIVKPDKYDDNIRVECTHGIHFFLTKEEAEEWL